MADTTPSIIRLMDSSGTVVMDSVSAEYEDSFSLESFEDLVDMHYECEPKGSRSFVIARVQTWDHKQPEKAFYSYYSAYQLNKILFQTQVYLGKKLIHRLHVLNPLTNTDIIGNVQYFMVKVKPPSAESDQSSGLNNKGGPGGGGRDKVNIIATAVHEDDEGRGDDEESGAGGGGGGGEEGGGTKERPISPATRPSSAPTLGGGDRRKKGLSINTNVTLPREYGVIVPPSPTVREIESGSTTSWTMAAPSVGQISEEEFPSVGPGPQRRKFSMVTLGLKSPYVGGNASPRKGSPLKVGVDLEENVEMKHTDSTTNKPPNLIVTSPPSSRGRATSFSIGPTDPDTPFIPAPTGPRRHSTQTPSLTTPVITRPPPPMIQMRANTKNNRKVIAVGTVTQFAVPVPRDQLGKVLLPTARSRRRALSYVNAVTASGAPASFEEWLELVRGDLRRGE
ncbi:hypothetical protein HK097_004855, partial [Rhizophlyctis rosea]